ncbi:MAG: DNA repair protein RecO [Erysipelotrichaceae bacterium]
MNDRFNGLVLAISEYREKDLLAHVLTKEYGRFSLVFKGANQVNSKRAFALNLCNEIEFFIDYQEGKNMYQVKSCSLIHSRHLLYQELNVLNSVQVMNEIALKLDDSDQVFDELNYIYMHIDAKNVWVFLSLFLVCALNKLGITPYVDGCVVCDESKIATISIEDGGFICQECLEEKGHYTQNQLRKFRFSNKANLTHYQNIVDTIDYDLKDVEILMEFLQYHSGLHIKSYALLESLNAL